MKHEYDQNVHTFWPTSAGLHGNFLFVVRSEANELVALPKMIDN